MTGAHSQTTIHFYYGTEQTTGAEILFPIRNSDFYLGGGFSGAWDVKETLPSHINDYDRRQVVTSEIREEWCSLYLTASAGYLGSVLVKYRGGLAVYQDKVTFNDSYTKMDEIVYRPIIGVSGVYSFNDYFGVEVGFDTFNKLTMGLTVNF